MHVFIEVIVQCMHVCEYLYCVSQNRNTWSWGDPGRSRSHCLIVQTIYHLGDKLFLIYSLKQFLFSTWGESVWSGSSTKSKWPAPCFYCCSPTGIGAELCVAAATNRYTVAAYLSVRCVLIQFFWKYLCLKLQFVFKSFRTSAIDAWN